MTEVADIFRVYGQTYCEKHRLPLYMYKVMNSIESCRTAKLGGHIDVCDNCGHQRISYNSCRNRHCPKCQNLNIEKWIGKRKNELLPVQYYHVVFTIPDDLNNLALRNKRVIYSLLFKASSETLKELARDKKYLGAKIGFISILHTWGQNLMDHPHIHCIVTGGGISLDKNKWIKTKNDFFIPIKVLSSLFKGKFLYYLKREYKKDNLDFTGLISPLKSNKNFQSLLNTLYQKNWVVYCKPSFCSPEYVIEYLGRYTNKVAISNHRIVNLADNKVTFKWKDYSDKNKTKNMTIDVLEFIRRFLLHVLPNGFVRIRYYGLLGNRYKKSNLELCQEMLNVYDTDIKKNTEETWQEIYFRLTGKDITACPKCHKGRMILQQSIRPSPNFKVA